MNILNPLTDYNKDISYITKEDWFSKKNDYLDDEEIERTK